MEKNIPSKRSFFSFLFFLDFELVDEVYAFHFVKNGLEGGGGVEDSKSSRIRLRLITERVT